MDKEGTPGVMDRFMKDSSSMIKLKEMEVTTGTMEEYTLDNGSRVK